MGLLEKLGPSLIGGGASIVGGLIGARSAEADRQQTDFWNQQSQEQNRKQFVDLQRRSIQWRVKDAKKAGLHPLFALGGTASGASPTPFIPGQTESGNALGRGIAQAGAIVGKGFLERAQAEMYTAAAGKDHASRLEILSRTKRAEQDALNIRAGISPGGGRGGVTVTLKGNEVYKGPDALDVTQSGKQVVPQFITVQKPDGTTTKALNPDLGLDEWAQVDYVARALAESGARGWETQKTRWRRWRKSRAQDRKDFLEHRKRIDRYPYELY